MVSNSGPESLYIPPEWTSAADSVVKNTLTSPSPPVVLVCGAKNCGKSTFSRFLHNTLLLRYEKVGYLDADVGQPEFSPPGFLSLTLVDQVTDDLTIPHMKTAER